MGKPPVAKKKMGSVELAIWETEGQKGKFYSYTFQKNRFNKTTEQWENVPFFNDADLPNLLAVIQSCVAKNVKTEIVQQQQSSVPQQQPVTPQQPVTTNNVVQNFSGQTGPFNDDDIPF